MKKTSDNRATIKQKWDQKTGKVLSTLALDVVEVLDFNGNRKGFGFASPRLLPLIRKLEEYHNARQERDEDCLFFETRIKNKITGKFHGRTS